jgi:hypothetical protein
VTSQHKVAANRINARRSTGPQTEDGKARASRNSTRHGLSSDAADPGLASKIAYLADMILPDRNDWLAYQHAMTIAECSILIARVRLARIHAIERMRTHQFPSVRSMHVLGREAVEHMTAGNLRKAIRSLKAQTATIGTLFEDARNATKAEAEARSHADVYVNGRLSYRNGKFVPRSDVEAIALALPELAALERYEQRALSRRRRAMIALSALKQSYRKQQACLAAINT